MATKHTAKAGRKIELRSGSPHRLGKLNRKLRTAFSLGFVFSAFFCGEKFVQPRFKLAASRFALKDFSATRIDVGVTLSKPAEELIPTQASLLPRIKDPNDGASWQEFHHTYRRLIFGVAQGGLERGRSRGCDARHARRGGAKHRRVSLRTEALFLQDVADDDHAATHHLADSQAATGRRFSTGLLDGIGHVAAGKIPALRDDGTARGDRRAGGRSREPESRRDLGRG